MWAWQVPGDSSQEWCWTPGRTCASAYTATPFPPWGNCVILGKYLQTQGPEVFLNIFCLNFPQFLRTVIFKRNVTAEISIKKKKSPLNTWELFCSLYFFYSFVLGTNENAKKASQRHPPSPLFWITCGLNLVLSHFPAEGVAGKEKKCPKLVTKERSMK